MFSLEGKDWIFFVLFVEIGGQNDSTGQYAHTYESLDTLEFPSRRVGPATAVVHLGISSRNYRTLLAHHQVAGATAAGHFTDHLITAGHTSLSPNTSNTTNLTELGNFNLSTSSASSTSGSSDTSTSKFLKPSLVNVNVPGLTQAQLIQLINAQQQQQQQQQCACVPLVGGTDANANTILQGTWSPDSAYYSSIPANMVPANYLGAAAYTLHQQQPHHHFLVNSSNGNAAFTTSHDQFKSHLV